jgi:hypothetical protein
MQSNRRIARNSPNPNHSPLPTASTLTEDILSTKYSFVTLPDKLLSQELGYLAHYVDALMTSTKTMETLNDIGKIN